MFKKNIYLLIWQKMLNLCISKDYSNNNNNKKKGLIL